MSELRIETWPMPGADLGSENVLPPLHAHRDLHVPDDSPDIPDDMLRNMAYGHVPNVLPYLMQDGYTRALRPRTFRVAVLENDLLKATFLLELGGRLWSLLHKPSGRELLSVNPVFQPANLALRNAWFCGGVEWNMGTIGHCPFTCSPLFAARVQGGDGLPVLRLYEWERIRRVPFQVDAYLPDGSPVLFVRVRMVNPHDGEIPMYWWSNMAVPETPDTRVLVPAGAAYSFGYGKGGLRRVSIPNVDETDITFTTHIKRAADFFFHIPDGQRPWITALGKDGRGLVQTSTARLKGRKLFLWGTGPGGKRWQTFLAQPEHAYLEIQAGLARTQMEHLAMPAGAEWAWLEAYGLMEAAPDVVHGDDWGQAHRLVDDKLERLIPGDVLDAEFERSAAWADRPPVAVLQRGSGWGALERRRREAAGEPAFCSTGLVFDDESLGDVQRPWLDLLDGGAMSGFGSAAPPSYMVQTEWRTLLEDVVDKKQGANWLAWLHLGVMRHYGGDRNGARQAWETSLKEMQTPWAMRNLAVLAKQEGQIKEAAELYVAALRLQPSLLPLAVECGTCLIEAELPGEWLSLLPDLPKGVRTAGRVRLLEGQAALAIQDFDRVERLFAAKLVIDDLREGERSLSHLWFEFHERRLSIQENIPIDDALGARVRREFPVPQEIDFRMSSDG